MCGVDEAGRGPLAGPVVAAAVILDDLNPIQGLNDSKALTERAARAAVRRDPRQGAVLLHRRGDGRGDRPHQHPAGDDAGDAPRGRGPAAEAGARCWSTATGCRCCAWRPRPSSRATRWCTAISAASILAKVHRDRLCLQTCTPQHPQYGFAGHKGYGTREHLEALRAHGACVRHRPVVRAGARSLDLGDPGLANIAPPDENVDPALN